MKSLISGRKNIRFRELLLWFYTLFFFLANKNAFFLSFSSRIFPSCIILSSDTSCLRFLSWENSSFFWLPYHLNWENDDTFPRTKKYMVYMSQKIKPILRFTWLLSQNFLFRFWFQEGVSWFWWCWWYGWVFHVSSITQRCYKTDHFPNRIFKKTWY